MESKFKSLSIFEFQEKFPDDRSCMEYLSDLKWQNGFVCKKCGHTHFCRGNREFDRQCTSCRYTESPTAGTLFHRVKFSMLKAFWIIYYMSTSKKGISSTELSRKLQLRQKTAWLFQQKVKEAMKSSGNYPLGGDVVVDELVVGQQEEGVRGRKNKNKDLVVFAIEKKGKGVSRLYGKVIQNASSKELGGFMKATISKDAKIQTDGWRGYTPLKKHFLKLEQTKSEKKGKNFKHIHRVIMGFKGWLRGVHHHAEHLQSYIDEYAYRFNRSFMKEGLFENLTKRMIAAQPITYKMIYQLNA
jgi:hypothetical protein